MVLSIEIANVASLISTKSDCVCVQNDSAFEKQISPFVGSIIRINALTVKGAQIAPFKFSMPARRVSYE